MNFDPEMHLSANFKLREFIQSNYATRLGMDIMPNEEIVDNLVRLCTTVLQPLRNFERSGIRILSGYRPPWLNEAIGGSKNSAHMFGCAADLVVEGAKNELICRDIAELKLPVDQCILEFPPNGWVHVGIERVGAPRRNQFLTARALHGKTQYSEGIHP